MATIDNQDAASRISIRLRKETRIEERAMVSLPAQGLRLPLRTIDHFSAPIDFLRTSQLYFCHFAGNKQKCAIIFAKRFFFDFNHLLFSGYSAHCIPSFSGSHFSCSLPLDPEHYVNVY
jgi:hypothetical protein